MDRLGTVLDWYGWYQFERSPTPPPKVIWMITQQHKEDKYESKHHRRQYRWFVVRSNSGSDVQAANLDLLDVCVDLIKGVVV